MRVCGSFLILPTHLSLMGEDGSELNESNPVDAAHAEYNQRVKERGWVIQKFMLTPAYLQDAMVHWGHTGQKPS